MPDIRGLVSDPAFDALSPEDKRDVLNRAGARPEFVAELLGESAGPRTGHPMARAPQIIGDAALGALKGAGTSLVGAAEMLAPPHLRAAFPSVGEAAGEARAALKPTSGPQQAGFNVEQLAEYALPGAAGLKVPRLGAGAIRTLGRDALQGAAEGALVGSAQAGQVDPGAIAGSAAGSVGGGALSRLAQDAAKWLAKNAHHTYAQIAPAAGVGAQKRVNEAIAEGLERGDLPGGSIEQMVAAQGAQTSKAGRAMNANAAANRGVMVNSDEVMDALRERIERGITRGPQGVVVNDEPMVAEAMKAFNKMKELRAQFGRDIPAEALESQRRAFDRLAKQDRASGVPDSAYKTAGDSSRSALDAAVPGREEATHQFHLSKELLKAMETAATKATTKRGSQVGMLGALRAPVTLGTAAVGGAGMAAAGPAGAAAALAVPAIAKILESPAWRAMSAKKQYAAAQALRAVDPEGARLLMTAIGGEVGGEEQDERAEAKADVTRLLQTGDKAGARQRALQYKRATGDRIDTRELERALLGVEDR